jgi:hypothetical protein
MPGPVSGHATDLNPCMEVSQAKCLTNIRCGVAGQAACRSMMTGGLVPEGEAGACYCTPGDALITYAKPASC